MITEHPVFICKKCGHNLHLLNGDIKKLIDLDCPNCGEESDELWLFGWFENNKNL